MHSHNSVEKSGVRRKIKNWQIFETLELYRLRMVHNSSDFRLCLEGSTFCIYEKQFVISFM